MGKEKESERKTNKQKKTMRFFSIFCTSKKLKLNLGIGKIKKIFVGSKKN